MNAAVVAASTRLVPLLLLLVACCARPVRQAPPPIGPEPSPPTSQAASAPVTPEAPAAPGATALASPYPPLAGFEGAFVVSAVPPATRVSVGREFSCALTRDGAVWCWGGEAAAEPGAEPPPFAGPRPLEGLTAMTGVSVAGERVCGVGGAIRCVGPALGSKLETAPALSDARTVSVGENHGCAVRQGGRVRCWGSGGFGELGTADPEAASDVPGVQQAVEVSVGNFGTCAVERTGKLVCWGAASLIPWAPYRPGYHGPKPTPPTALRGVGDVAHISLRSGRPCLVRRTGRVLCWAPEDAPTLLPQNPLPAGSEVRGLTDAVSISGAMVVRAGGRLAVVERQVDDQGNDWDEAKPVGEGALAEVIDADGTRQQGCAVERSGRVVCWKSEP